MTVRRRIAREPALVVIVAIGLALRLAWLGQPIRYDEAVTYLGFVRGGLANVVTNYDVPNNHVFHSALVWLTTLTSSSVYAIRLPVFVAGALVPPATYLVGRRLHGRGAALVGAALVACSVHLIEYATNARGYSIVTLFALLQVLLADRIGRDARHRDLAAFAIVTALGLWTVPTMLYPTAATLAWATIISWSDRRATPWRTLAWRVPLYGAIGAATTLALYAPILVQPEGVEKLTANHWLTRIESVDAWRMEIAHVGGHLVDDWSLGLTTPGLMTCLALAVFGFVRRREMRATWTLVAAAVVIAICFAQRVAPFPRVFCFALPMVLLPSAAGVVEVQRLCRWTRWTPAVAIVLCVGLAAYVAVARLPDRAGTADKFPDAAAVVRFLSPKVAAGDAIICDVVPSAPIQYALFRKGRPPFAYRAGASRLWIVTRGDGVVVDALRSRSNRLRPEDFNAPRLAFSRGDARVYEAVPRDGRTPDQQRKRRR